MMCTLQSSRASVTLVKWDESQVTFQGEEQASKNVSKPRLNVVQVGPGQNGRMRLKSLGQVERSDGKQIKVIISSIKGR